MNNLYLNKNYSMDIPFLFNHYIREYDISKSNINVLFMEGIINSNQYETFYNMDRDTRQYTIGMMLRENSDLNKVLSDGVTECRKWFMDQNCLEENDILSIKNDAIYVIDKQVKFTKYNNVEFRNKNTYTSFMSLNGKRLELYYSSINRNFDECILDVKGISDKKLLLHKNHFLDFLYFIFDVLETESAEYVIPIFQNFFHDYINRSLDIRYYRNFNSESDYTIKAIINGIERLFSITSDYSANKNINDVNIVYNMNLLREIFRNISTYYKL